MTVATALPTAPFYAEVAQGPKDVVAHWITAADGPRLRVVYWPAEPAKGTILLFPGRTEYAEKYGQTARDYVSNGYSVLTIDWRGQGLAARLVPDVAKGHVHKFRDYQHDVQAMVAAARDLGAAAPFFLIAHSMGGAIGLRALHDGLPVQAAVFSAPMWGINMHPALRPAALAIGVISQLTGQSQNFAPGQSGDMHFDFDNFDANSLTSDREAYAAMIRQLQAHPALALGGPTVQWVYSALRETKRLAAMTPPKLPCLTYLGTEESIVDPARIHSIMSRWKGGTLHMLTGARHEVLMETPPIRAKILAETCAFFDKNHY